jgi:DNA-binding transcriptional MerR regulator
LCEKKTDKLKFLPNPYLYFPEQFLLPNQIMKPISQISLFGEEPAAREEAAGNELSERPVNVGLRIKKLKDPPINTDPEPSIEEIAKAIHEPVPLEKPENHLHITPVEIEEKHAAVKTITIKQKSTRGRKSIKAVEAEADLIEIPEDEILFQKQYYTMGEVATMFRVNQSLLRFWEAEFSILQPHKNKKGDRYFRPTDVKNLHLIYHLLRQRKYTIEGAKDFLKKNKKANQRFEVVKKLEQIRAFILELKTQL